MHDVFDPLHFNCAAGIYRQARSRSSRQEYSQMFLLWKSCKITKYFVLLFIQCYYDDMTVYSSYLPNRDGGWREESRYISGTMHSPLEGWSFYYLSVVYLVSAVFSFNWKCFRGSRRFFDIFWQSWFGAHPPPPPSPRKVKS